MPTPDATDPTAAGGDAPPAGGDFAALAPDLTRRIEVILEAVQREADKMLDEARGEARRRVDTGRRQADGLLADRRRRIAELSDTLIERTESVVAQLEETQLVRDSFGRLLQALAESADRLTEEVVAAPEPQSGPPPPPPADRPWIEARQAAIRMAAAGNTRAQVETHLRGVLSVPDSTALLDQVFGAATAGEARVPWAMAPTPPMWQPDGGSGSPMPSRLPLALALVSVISAAVSAAITAAVVSSPSRAAGGPERT
jgi:hypothetical protein